MLRDVRAVAVLVLLLTSSLGSSPARANQRRAREFYKRGMAEYVLDHYDAAIRAFEEGFKEEPEPSFLYNIGQAHRKAGRPQQAIQYFEKYLDMRPDAADAEEVRRQIVEMRASIPAGTPPPPPVTLPSPPAAAPPTSPSPLEASPAPVEKTPPATVPPAAMPPIPSASSATGTAAPPAHKSRWPMWLGIAAGAVGVAVAVGVTVAYTTPHDADVPSTGLGNIDVSLH